jgi:hypothetical protein
MRTTGPLLKVSKRNKKKRMEESNYTSAEENIELLRRQKEEKERVNALPPITSEDLQDIQPLGSLLIVRPYRMPAINESGTILSDDERSWVPCVEILRKGPRVQHAEEGQWALLNHRTSEPGFFARQHEGFHLIQESDIAILYDEKPPYQEVSETDTYIFRDPTDYVKIDKMSKIEAKTETIYLGDPDEETRDKHA